MPTLSGIVKDSTGGFAQRLVRAYRRDTGALIGQTVSNASTGAYTITTAYTGEHFVVCHDGTVVVGDLSWDSVTLACHFNGEDGSTIFTDEKGVAVSTPYGDAKISTAQSKFGGSSLKLDGSGDWVKFNASSALDFGLSDFTWEAWIYRTAVNDATYADAIWCSVASPVGFAVGIKPGGNIALAIDSTAGGDWDIRLGVDPGQPVGSTAIPLATWTHIAVTREGSTFRGFVNGVMDQTFTHSGTISNAAAGYYIGHWHDGWVRSFNGYIDDLRITKGVARYTANFTPPTAAFLGGDSLTGGAENLLAFDRVTPV